MLKCCDFKPSYSSSFIENLPLTVQSQVIPGVFVYLSQRLLSCGFNEVTSLRGCICYSW